MSASFEKGQRSTHLDRASRLSASTDIDIRDGRLLAIGESFAALGEYVVILYGLTLLCSFIALPFLWVRSSILICCGDPYTSLCQVGLDGLGRASEMFGAEGLSEEGSGDGEEWSADCLYLDIFLFALRECAPSTYSHFFIIRSYLFCVRLSMYMPIQIAYMYM